jgi:RHS repeat-associated protein
MQDPTTKLVHFGARDFAPQLGRWITKDPSGMAGGVNLFGYAAGDPLDFIDADGQNPAAVAVAVGVVLLGGGMVQSSDDYPGVAAYGAVVGTGAALAASGLGSALGRAVSSVWGRVAVGALGTKQDAVCEGVEDASAAVRPLVYGPSAGGKLAELAEKLGGETLTQMEKPVEMSFRQFSIQTLNEAAASGRPIVFDLTNMQEIPGVLDGTSQYAGTVTAMELRHIQANWSSFEPVVKFLPAPPW